MKKFIIVERPVFGYRCDYLNYDADTALESTSIFLLLNGYDLCATPNEWGRLTIQVTNGPDSEKVMLEIAHI